MDQELTHLLWLVLGWLFGLLGPGIAERIRRAHRAKNVVDAVTGELIEMQFTMGLVANTVRARSATLTDEFLDWLYPIVKNYTGPDADPKWAESIEGLRGKKTEAERQAIFLAMRSPATGLDLKEYSLPVLASLAAELSICPMNFQRGALRVKQQLDIFNQQVVQLKWQFNKTFDPGVQDDNRQALMTNIENGYAALARMAQRFADAVTALQTNAKGSP
jgi:hypothetical protein